jgi:hypothetical protein
VRILIMLNYKIICKIIQWNLSKWSIRKHFRFDVAILIKSFNGLSTDDKQKLLKNLLQTLKSDSQVFVYESEWSKDKGKIISSNKNLRNIHS